MIAICDTGPLLAYLNRNDPHHAWAVALMKQVRPPMLVSEPVLTEVVRCSNRSNAKRFGWSSIFRRI